MLGARGLRLLCVLGTCAVAVAVGVGGGGCSKKKSHKASAPSPEVTGLAAVPATAQAVISADVGKLSGSPIVDRAIDQLLLRDPQLAARWRDVRDGCKLELATQIRHVTLALGSPGQGATGSGPVLMVATGTLAEPDLAGCVRTMVGKGGGGLTAKMVAGRSLYQVQDGNRTMYFAFGRPDTVVLGTDEAWVIEGLGTGKKALDDPELARWLGLVDQRAPLWAIGRVDERVRVGLVSAAGGKLDHGPTAIVASVDLATGAKLALGAVMATGDDAKKLETFAKGELALIGMVAQARSLGPLVAKLGITVAGPVVWFRAGLGMDEVNQLLSVLDEKPAPEQVTPPPAGSGSSSPE